MANLKRKKQKRELLTAAEETRVEEIHNELDGIVEEITANPEMPEEELTDLEDQVDELLGELEEIAPTEEEAAEEDGSDPPAGETRKAKRARVMKKLASRAAAMPRESRAAYGGGVRRETPPAGRDSEAQQRGRDLMQMRTVTVGSSNIVLPKHYGTDIRPTFNEVSSLVDLVNINVLPGGESYTQAFEKEGGIADYTSEGDDAKEADPVVDYVEINKAKLTAYAEDTEEVLKLPAANYDALVMASSRKAIRKKLAREILVGTGATNHLTGIFKAPAKVIPTTSDLAIEAIDENTLDEIIFSYGGDEDVEGQAALILNKADLKAFSSVRGTENKQKVYDIELNGNTGYINKIPFIINSACGVLSADATANNAYCMAYGNLSNYTLAVFSDIDVARSTDHKFRQGMIAHRGVGFMGGNVTSWKGFVRVKKKKTA